MNKRDFTQARWRKSSHSQQLNDQCVEIASDAEWRKSIRSQVENDQCVEVSGAPRYVAVRDSKNPGGANLVFTATEWRALVSDIKSGRLG